MVFDGSGEVRPGIEEACNSCVVLGEDLDDCWKTEDSWFGLMNGSFHGGKLRYHRWRQLMSLLVNVIAIKTFVIRSTVKWRPGWLLTNRGQLRWIDDRIIQWKRNRYHRQWHIDSLWVTVVAIKSPVITRSRSPTNLVFPGSTFVAPPKTLLGTWHDK